MTGEKEVLFVLMINLTYLTCVQVRFSFAVEVCPQEESCLKSLFTRVHDSLEGYVCNRQRNRCVFPVLVKLGVFFHCLVVWLVSLPTHPRIPSIVRLVSVPTLPRIPSSQTGLYIHFPESRGVRLVSVLTLPRVPWAMGMKMPQKGPFIHWFMIRGKLAS